ncbi:MAG TPA: class I SAM-dependent methyltransferase [Myxococcota bacterium]|nr:class I SAM-dependent methyltransferase [Myxococcota bacterium]
METEALYDRNAGIWSRNEPRSISDFTGRPAIFDLCGDVKGARVLDLGCGEGYCSREMALRGADEVLGIDLSTGMVEQARAREEIDRLGIRYRRGNVVRLETESDRFDLVLAVFVFSYVTCEEMERAFREVRRVLAPGGRFVFAVPHPGLPFMREQRPPFYFDTRGGGYFSGQDERYSGAIECIDGGALPVHLVHKPLESYFDALASAGFERMPILRELRVLEAHLDARPELFGPLADLPLHLALRVEG